MFGNIEGAEKGKIDISQNYRKSKLSKGRQFAKIEMQKFSLNVMPGRVYDWNRRGTATYAEGKTNKCQRCNEVSKSNQTTMGNSTFLSLKFEGKQQSSIKLMNSSSSSNIYHKVMTNMQFGNFNKNTYESEALGTIFNNSKAEITFEHSAMSNVSLTQYKKLKDCLELQRNSQDDLHSKLRQNDSSIPNLMYHNSVLNASSKDCNRTSAKRIEHKSKSFKHLIERNQKLKTLINNKHRYFSLSRRNAKEASYRKSEHRKRLMQKAIFGKKLKRLFEDLESLFFNTHDKKMIGNFLKGLYSELKDKNKVEKKHKFKHKKGQESKDRGGKSHESKIHHARGLKIVDRSNRQNSNLRRPDLRNKHRGRALNSSSPIVDSNSRLPNTTYSKQELLKYILAQNIIRSGWPFLLQKGNRTEFSYLLNMLRERIALKEKEVNNLSATAALASPLETMKATHKSMNSSPSNFHNGTILPVSSSSGKSLVNFTQYQPVLSLVQPSYSFASTRIEKTPYLPMRSQWYTSSQAVAPASLERNSYLLQTSSRYIPYTSTSKPYTLYHISQLSKQGNTSTVLHDSRQRVSSESVFASLKLQTFPYTSSFATVLNSSSFVSFDAMSDVRSSNSTKANTSSSYRASLENNKAVASSSDARSTMFNQDASNLDEKLISDLIDAYKIVLEEKLPHSNPPYATVNYPTESKEISRLPSSSLQNSIITSTRLKGGNSLDFVSQSRDVYSTSVAKIDKNDFPLIDEEASLPLKGMKNANGSEVEDKFENQKHKDSSSSIEDNDRLAIDLQQQIKAIPLQNSDILIKSSLSYAVELKTRINLVENGFISDKASLSNRNLLDLKLTDDIYRNATDDNENGILKETKTKHRENAEQSNAREIDANIEGIEYYFLFGVAKFEFYRFK